MSVEKERLVRTIRDQEQQLEKLRREVDILRKENDRLKDNPSEPAKKEARWKKKGLHGKQSKRWGRKKGHKGSSRPIPEHIDREKPLTLEACPDCHHALDAPYDFEEHIQEDIVPAKVEVTRYLHYRYWCRHCHAHVVAPHAPDEVPHGHLGPKVLTVMALLKYH